MEENKEHINTGDCIVGLDIGTTKISVMIGRKNQYGKLEILGTGKAVSIGVSRGIVANIDQTVTSIKEAVEEAKQKSGIDIADIRSRALTGSDPGLHFLPQASATTAYAQGGRTGYYAGDSVGQGAQQNMIIAFSTYKNAGGKEDHADNKPAPQSVIRRGVTCSGDNGRNVKQTVSQSIKEAIQLSLDWEIKVTDEINNLIHLATQEKDHITVNFLNWFLDEQLEELSKRVRILKIFK